MFRKRKVIAYTEKRTKISGVTYKCPHTKKPRQRIIKRHVRPGTRLIPQLEPDNPHDPNAIGLWLVKGWFIFRRRYHIGYIPRERARTLAIRMRAGTKLAVIVRNVTGGTRKKRTRGVNIIIRY